MPKAAPKTKATTKSEDKPIEVFNGTLSDGRIFETIYNPMSTPSLQFVIASPREQAQATIQDSVELGSTTKYPPGKLIKWIAKNSILLPSGVADYDNSSALLHRIQAYVGQYLDFPPFEISLIVHYAMMTWVWDAFTAFPYLRFKGEPATGKTRSLQVLKQLCYRATDLGGASSKSAIFRIIDKVRGTVLIDESDYEADLRSDLIKLLNVGYCKDGTHSISTARGNNWEPDIYNVGCPKVLANREDFPDRALETRCLTIFTQSKKQAKHIPIELPPVFFRNGLELRNRLLQWRIDTLRNINKSESKLRHLDGRVIQLALPLYSISPDDGFKDELLRRLIQQSDELREQDPLRIVLEAIVAARRGSQNGAIPVKHIRSLALEIAKQREVPLYELSEKRTAELIRALQFKTPRYGTGYHVRVNEKTLAMQCEHLRLDSGERSESSEEVVEAA